MDKNMHYKDHRKTLEPLQASACRIYKKIPHTGVWGISPRILRKAFYLVLVSCMVMITNTASALKIADFDVDITGKVGERFDDNVTYVKDGEKDDFITDLDAGFDIKRRTKTWDMDLTGTLRQDIYVNNNSFNNFSQDVGLDAAGELTKYDRITVSDSFLHAEEPRSFEDESGNEEGRYDYYRNNFNFGYSRDIARQFSIDLGYANGIFIPDKTDISDSYLNSGRVVLNYLPNTATILYCIYDFTHRHFEPGGDSPTHSTLGGIRRYFTETVYFDGYAGADFIRTTDKKDLTKLNLMGSVTGEFSEKTKAVIKFDKKFNQTYYSGDVSDFWSVSGSVSSNVLKRVNIDASVYFSRGEYEGNGRTDNFFGSNMGLSYDLMENVKASLSYNFSLKDSDEGTNEYVKNVISAGVGYRF